MVDTYNMNTDKDIVDDLQIRSLAYNLYRKYGRFEGVVSFISVSEVLSNAVTWAALLGMEEWQGHEAYRAWKNIKS